MPRLDEQSNSRDERKGKRRKRRFNPWDSIEDILSDVSSNDETTHDGAQETNGPEFTDSEVGRSSSDDTKKIYVDQPSNARAASPQSADASPTLGTQFLKNNDFRKSAEVLEQSYGTKFRNKIKSVAEKVGDDELVSEQSSRTKFHNKDIEQKYGTEFRNNVPEHKSLTESCDQIHDIENTEVNRNKEILVKISSGTKLQN